MKIDIKDLDELNSTITMIIEKDDYSPQFDSELKKYKNKAHLKGFRKGKVPISAIKKMYGKTILAEIINKLIDKKLMAYITDQSFDILGSPIPSPDQETIDFDLKDPQDFTFLFDIGKAPAIEVSGVSSTDSYELLKVEIEDEKVNEEFELRRKQMGAQVEIEDSIEEDDILTIKAVELDGDKIKDGGWDTGFTIMVSRIADEDLKAKLKGLKKGDKFRFNIYTLEKDATEDYVKKYFLNLDENEDKEIAEDFEGTIDLVQRVEPAELNKEFFEKLFPGLDVDSEATAKAQIKDDLDAYYEGQTKSVMYREIMDTLINDNKVSIPDDFLKRWLIMTNKDVTEQTIEEEYEGFAKNMNWTLIKTNLVKKLNVTVEPDELRAAVKKKLQGYMSQYGGGADMDYEPMVDRYLSDRKQVEKEYSEVEAERLFDEIEKVITVQEKSVTVDELTEIVKKLNEKANQQ